jgi:hypothetical protein
MKSQMGWRTVAGLWSVLVCLGVAQAQTSVPGSAVNPPALVVGEVVFSRGVGFAQTPGQTPRTLGVGLHLQQGDRLTTAAGASAIVKLTDGTRMTLRPQSDMVLEQVRYTPNAPDNNLLLELLQGGFRAITGLISKGSDRAALVKTPTATIGIRGTDFDARLCGTDCFEETRAVKDAPRAASLRASAKVVVADGELTATSDAGDKRKLVHGGSIYPGDMLETGPRTKVVLAFRDESKITLGAATTFKVDDFVFDQQSPSDGRFLVSLLKGTVRALTGLIGKAQPRNVAFKTPTATIGIRGTGIDLSCESAGCQFFTWLGTMTVTPEGQTALQILQAGQGLFVSPTGMTPINALPLPGLDRPDQVPVDVGPLFSATAVDETVQGLYVFVRDGHIQITTPSGGLVHLGRGEVGLADNAGRVLRPLQMPQFLDLDPTPLPNNANPLLTTVLEEAGVRTQNQCRR